MHVFWVKSFCTNMGVVSHDMIDLDLNVSTSAEDLVWE